MIQFSIILFILCCLISLSRSHHEYDCHHDQQQIKLDFADLSLETSNDTTRTLQDYHGIRIFFDFSTASDASADFIDYAKNIILPPIKNLFEKALRVQRLAGNLTIASNQVCENRIQTPEIYLNGGVAADLVVFVTTSYEPTSDYIAAADSCILNTGGDNRPVVGKLNYNLFDFAPTTKDVRIESDIYTTMHELTHVLGFSSKLYSYYIDTTSKTNLTGHIGLKTVNGVKIQYLDLPTLTSRLRTYFNCPTLEGAYLENQGGSQSTGSHFERRIFFNEYMTASSIKDSRLSEFTLAILEGTGWYQVDYSYAEPMTYGKNRGCEFLDTPCMNKQTKSSNFPSEFCTGLTTVGSFYTGRGVGPCGAGPSLNTQSSLRSSFDYWGNKTIVADKFADNCPHTRVYTNIDCEDSTLQSSAFASQNEYYGFGAKGFVGTLSPEDSPLSSPYGYCFLPKCNLLEDGSYSLEVKIGKQYVTCHRIGQINPPSSSGLVGKLFCPDPNAFCERILGEGNCKGNCFGRGACVNQQCKCDDGWGFHDCIKRSYTNNCKRCEGQDPLRTSCYGDDACECNPTNTTCMCGLGLMSGRICTDPDYLDTGSTSLEEKRPNQKTKIIIIAAGAGGGTIALILVVILLFKCGKSDRRNSQARQNPGVQKNPYVVRDAIIEVENRVPQKEIGQKADKSKKKKKGLFSREEKVVGNRNLENAI